MAKKPIWLHPSKLQSTVDLLYTLDRTGSVFFLYQNEKINEKNQSLGLRWPQAYVHLLKKISWIFWEKFMNEKKSIKKVSPILLSS